MFILEGRDVSLCRIVYTLLFVLMVFKVLSVKSMSN